jgi:hypothetical protein
MFACTSFSGFRESAGRLSVFWEAKFFGIAG